jgi:threonine/homoserine/homoserine lactone efflux protein
MPARILAMVVALLALFVWVTAQSQPSSTAKDPGAAAGKNQTTGPVATGKGLPANEHTPIAIPPITVVVQQPPSNPEAEARQRQREERSQRINEALMVVGILTLFFVGWQAWETRREANAVMQQVVAATTGRASCR